MRMRFDLLNKPELDFIKENCMLSGDDRIILYMSAQKHSILFISQYLNLSESATRRRKKKIYDSIISFLEVADVTTVYINGKKISENELKNQEITNEKIKKMIASISRKLTNQN